MKMTAQEAIGLILRQAPGILQKDKYHAPILFVFGESEDALVMPDFHDTESKHATMLISGGKLASLKPQVVVLVCEAWMSRTMPPEGMGVSDLPDRIEVLHVIAQSSDRNTEAVSIPFTRVDGEIVLDKPILGHEVESYLLELFWQGVSLGQSRD